MPGEEVKGEGKFCHLGAKVNPGSKSQQCEDFTAETVQNISEKHFLYFNDALISMLYNSTPSIFQNIYSVFAMHTSIYRWCLENKMIWIIPGGTII